MASKSLGTLTIDLIAKVGGFVSGMNQAERSSDKWRKQVEKDAEAVGAAIGKATVALGAAAIGIGVSAFAITKSVSDSVTETDRWAKSLGLSTTELQKWQYAASKAGVEGDKIADIFKDLNDKIGDAVLNKSGEAAQALDTLGLSAKKLQNLSPDKQLLAISGAMAGMNTAQKTTIYEALGNDLSKLIPLLDNGAAGFQKLAKQAADSGIALPQDDIDKMLKFNLIIQDIETSWDGFKNKMAVGLSQIDLSGLVSSLNDIEKVFTDPQVLQGISNIITGLSKMVALLAQGAKFANDIAYGWNKTAQTTNDSSFNDLLAKRNELNESLAYSESFLGKIDAAAGVIRSSKEIQAEIAKNEKLISNFSERHQLPTGLATLSGNADLKLAHGESNQKTHPKKNTAGIKLENSFKATEMAYQRQIALIDTTGKKTVIVTEQQKLAFDFADGKLAGLNDKQKQRLELLAKEVDRLKTVKKANEDNLKVAEFIANLQKENSNAKQTLDIDIIGASQGENTRNRMKELLGIQKDYLDKQADLQKQFDSGDIDKDVYDRKTQALNDSLEERLELQKKHYKDVDDLQNNGTAGFMSGLQTQIEASANLYANMQQVGGQAFSSLTDMIIEWAETGKMNVKDFAATFLQSMGAALLQYAAAQVAMAALQAFSGMIGVPYVGPAIAPAAATAAAAGAGVLMLGVSSALKGQAHDGIDSVPETGTWLLQKGERVTTAQTSAKLDATLDRVSTQSAPSMPTQINIPTTVNGDPDARTLQMLKDTQRAAVKEALMQSAHQIATGTGHVGKAVGAGWNTKRRKG